jgi:hypothetical protein
MTRILREIKQIVDFAGWFFKGQTHENRAKHHLTAETQRAQRKNQSGEDLLEKGSPQPLCQKLLFMLWLAGSSMRNQQARA